MIYSSSGPNLTRVLKSLTFYSELSYPFSSTFFSIDLQISTWRLGSEEKIVYFAFHGNLPHFFTRYGMSQYQILLEARCAKRGHDQNLAPALFSTHASWVSNRRIKDCHSSEHRKADAARMSWRLCHSTTPGTMHEATTSLNSLLGILDPVRRPRHHQFKLSAAGKVNFIFPL